MYWQNFVVAAYHDKFQEIVLCKRPTSAPELKFSIRPIFFLYCGWLTPVSCGMYGCAIKAHCGKWNMPTNWVVLMLLFSYYLTLIKRIKYFYAYYSATFRNIFILFYVFSIKRLTWVICSFNFILFGSIECSIEPCEIRNLFFLNPIYMLFITLTVIWI